MILTKWRARPVPVLVLLLGAAAIAAWWWMRPTRWDDSAHPPPPVRRAIELYASAHPREAEESLRKFLRNYRAPSWEARARLLAAAKMASHGRGAEILSMLPSPLDAAEP